jgi:hypothetical protein
MLTWVRNIFHHAYDAEQRQRWWDARMAVLEDLLGPCDQTVWHAPSPLHRMGFADVLRFRHYVNGVAYVTCELIGNEHQVPNRWGPYELMICTREENDWAPRILSRLGQYTREATLQPGDTMDLGDESPPDSTIKAFLFCRPDPPADHFKVLGVPANLILCLGITAAEFTACKNFGSGVVLRMLRDNNQLPYTDLQRPSVME